jgi:aryl-alcohol dehydrogenase-like predicted oxidoreductase
MMELGGSRIAMGCVTFGREIGEAESFDILDAAVERGIRVLDTAMAYGDGASETVLGQWLKRSGMRDRVVLASKVNGVLSRERIVRAAEDSLRRLQTDRIDLYQLHNWDPATPLDETLGALDALVREGKVRAVGCSNVSDEQLAIILSRQDALGFPRMDAVQPIYNLVHREIEGGLLPRCAREGLAVVTYSPLGAGFLTGKYHRDGPLPVGARFDIKPGHQAVYFTDHGWAVLERVRRIAAEADVPMSLLALAWVLTRPGVTGVLVGARNVAQLEQAFEAAVLAESLDPGVLDALGRASER